MPAQSDPVSPVKFMSGTLVFKVCTDGWPASVVGRVWLQSVGLWPDLARSKCGARLLNSILHVTNLMSGQNLPNLLEMAMVYHLSW